MNNMSTNKTLHVTGRDIRDQFTKQVEDALSKGYIITDTFNTGTVLAGITMEKGDSRISIKLQKAFREALNLINTLSPETSTMIGVLMAESAVQMRTDTYCAQTGGSCWEVTPVVFRCNPGEPPLFTTNVEEAVTLVEKMIKDGLLSVQRAPHERDFVLVAGETSGGAKGSVGIVTTLLYADSCLQKVGVEFPKDFVSTKGLTPAGEYVGYWFKPEELEVIKPLEAYLGEVLAKDTKGGN